MGKAPTRYLPQVALATFAVAGLPALIVSAAQAVVSLPAILAIVLAMLLSLVLARLGSAFWMRRPGSRDIVFADLMVWGWLRRMRAERRLAKAEELLGHGELPLSRRAELMKTLAAGLEARDSYTQGHSKRVARHSEAIARAMGLSREQVAKVRTAAAVHDVGKMRTPRAILTKPGKLDDAELAVMKRHVRDGADMVSGLGDPEITTMVMGHHERLDGSGYPAGLPDEQITLGARIIAVADTFDAMTSSRPYRSAAPHKRAMDTLVAESPVRLDARAVAAFRAYYTGERKVPVSAFLTTAPQRFGPWFAGLLQGESAVPLAQGLSALTAAAAVGTSGMTGLPVNEHGSSPQRAPTTSNATARAAPAGSPSGTHRFPTINHRAAAGGGAGTHRKPGARGRARSGAPARRRRSVPKGATPRPPRQVSEPSHSQSPSHPQPHPPPQRPPMPQPQGRPPAVQPTPSIKIKKIKKIKVEKQVKPPRVLPVKPGRPDG
jgi:putative nucleotidyltransferase with HDIG domain